MAKVGPCLALLVLVLSGCSARPAMVDDAPPPFDPAPTEDIHPEVRALRERVWAAIAQGKPVELETTSARDWMRDLPLKRAGQPAPREQRRFQVELVPSTLLGVDVWAEIDGNRTALPFVEVFEGNVQGSPDELARLTIARHWARGSIRTNGGELFMLFLNHSADWLPKETGTARPGDGPPPGGPTLTSGDPIKTLKEEYLIGKDCGTPPPLEPRLWQGRARLPLLPIRIVMEADQWTMDRFGEEAFPLMVALVADADLVYHHQVAMRYEIVGLSGHTQDQYTSGKPFYQLAKYWNARKDVARDVVYLLNGHPTASFGQAACIGAAGLPEDSFAVGALNLMRREPASKMLLLTHEIGHLFNAHHHYGNHVEAEGATLMIAGYTPGLDPTFSSLERSHIRGWGEQYLGKTRPPIAGLGSAHDGGAADLHVWT